MEHVVVRRLEHLTVAADRPDLGFTVETRDRPGPAHKSGAGPDEDVWVQLHGGLFVARAAIKLAWIGEYSSIAEVRARTKGSALHDLDAYWQGRPRFGYAAIASLQREKWIDPFWAGPRSYAYEWILLENDKKRASWLDEREAPRGGDTVRRGFDELRAG